MTGPQPQPIDGKEAQALLECEGPEIYELFHRAHRVRLAAKGLLVRLCGVLNAKSGLCPEDCAFCAQSAHSDTGVETYPLVNAEQMFRAARAAEQNSSSRIGIVTSGPTIDNAEELTEISRGVERIASELTIAPCASLGNIDKNALAALREAGLKRYHHNLETAESFFGRICTTRSWSESQKTILAAKEVGLQTCCGGLFGLGESLAQRVELLAAVRDLDVDAVPLNFYHPIPGTRLAEKSSLTPLACLKIVAVARLMMPQKEIRVCGGRELNLRDLQSWILKSGACGLMVGGYLTTSGRAVDQDLAMIADAGFEVESAAS